MSYGKRNKNITKTNKRPKNNFKMKRDTVTVHLQFYFLDIVFS